MWRRLLIEVRGPETKNNEFNLLFGNKPNLSLFRFPKLIRAYVCSSPEVFDRVLSSTQRSAIDEADATGNTALSWAVHFGDYNTVKRLLLLGSDPGQVDSRGQAPMHAAVPGRDVACVQLLLNAKADVNPSNFLGVTAMHIAAQGRNTKIIELLLSCGASIESEDVKACRPLHYAVCSNSPANLQLLLERGANINAANNFGATTLMLSVMYNAHEALKLLLREETLEYNCKDIDGNSVIDFAAIFGDLETLYILQSSRKLKRVGLDVDKALGYAVQRRDHNEAQSISMLKTMDNDPHAWYLAFRALYNDILESDSEEWEASTEEELMDDDESSELYYDDVDDGESEFYEDAQESPNGSTI